ncbi:MAG: hypothetical protein IPI84_14705 [Holophagaceae bacterium]|nr:hypothetical protein [Holophagaceae bacterium]
MRDALRGSGGEPLLCGSGSCWAARYDSIARRDAAAGSLRAAHQAWRVWTL